MGPRHGRWPPSWRCISRVDAMPGVPSTISTTPGRMPCGAMPIRKRSPISPRGWRCWRRSPRPRGGPSRNLTCRSPWDRRSWSPGGLHPLLWNRSTPGRRSCASRWGETPQLFPVLWGLWRLYNNRCEYQRARALGEQLLSLSPAGPRCGAPPGGPPRAVGHLAPSRRFTSARAHLEQGRALLRSPAAPRICLALWRPRYRCVLSIRWGLCPVIAWLS